VAQPNRGRVSVPAQAALSGSHNQAPGFAGGIDFLHLEAVLAGMFDSGSGCSETLGVIKTLPSGRRKIGGHTSAAVHLQL
jgi:hypothetical protein